MKSQATTEGFKLQTKELVRVLCHERTKENREIERWIHDGLILIAQNAEEFSIPNEGKKWDVLTNPDGTFRKAVLFMDLVDTSTAVDILINDISPIIRHHTKPSVKKASSRHSSAKRYTLYRHPGSRRVQAVEHRFDIFGAVFGPLWLAYKGGSFSLVVLSFFASTLPLLIFGINTWTIFWAIISWSIHARSNVGLQGVRLKQLGYVRLGDVTADSSDDAVASANQQ